MTLLNDDQKWWKNVPEDEIEKHYQTLKGTKFAPRHYDQSTRKQNIQTFHEYTKKNSHRIVRGDKVKQTFFGSRIITPYHPHRYSERTTANSSDRPATEAWKKEERLKRAIRLTIAKGKEPTYENVRNTFMEYKLGRIPTFFSPAQSAGIIQKYSKPGDTVLDPFSGYGGSIPAAASLNRKFIGIDLNERSIKGNRKMARDLTRTLKLPKDQLQLMHGDSPKTMNKDLPANSVNLIYTSPPYFDRERYGKKGTGQSWEKENYQKWLTDFYVPTLKGMNRVVKKEGTVAINIAPLKKNGLITHALDKHTVALAKEMGFKYVGKKKLMIGFHGGGNPGFEKNMDRYEPILIFKKTGKPNVKSAKAKALKLAKKSGKKAY